MGELPYPAGIRAGCSVEVGAEKRQPSYSVQKESNTAVQRARGAHRMDRVYVGWRYAQAHPDPGPEPRRPAPLTAERATWVEAAEEHGGEKLLNRQLKFTAGGAGVGAAVFLLFGMTGLLFWHFVIVGLIACAVIIGITGW